MTGWAVGSEEIPSHKDADTYAAELARLGVNCVRLHFLDRPDTENPVRNEGADRSPTAGPFTHGPRGLIRSEEHTSELQSLMRISYAVFCLKKKNAHNYLSSSLEAIK